jgi:type I restriction enzyme S subunit
MSGRRDKLGSVVTLKRGYDLPEQHRVDGVIPVVSSSGITGTHNESKVAGPGVVTGRYGTLGQVFYVPEDFWPLNTALYVRDFHGNDRRFVAYFLESVLRSTQSDKAAVPGVNRNDLHEMTVTVPEKPAQGRIVALLARYDDLIENNTRRIKLLEDAARLLYEEWFVRLRFPGNEHSPIRDGVPKGWEHIPTPEAIDINPTTRLSDAKEHWWVEMSDLPLNSMVVQGTVLREGRSGSKFQNGDTLFARITPCLENGKTAFVDFLPEGVTARGSTEFIVLRSKRLSPEFVYCLARTYAFRHNAIKSMIGASGRQRVQDSCFDKFMVNVPPPKLLTAFTDIVRPIFRQIRVLHLQSTKAREARDLLLPRLMSGEVAV